MWPSAPRVCSEPGGQKPVLSLSLDLIEMNSYLHNGDYRSALCFFARSSDVLYRTTPIWKYSPYILLIFNQLCRNAKYRQTSNISRTKPQNWNISRFILQLSLPDPLKSDVRLGMKMYLEQRRQAMLKLHLSDQQFHCLLRYRLY